MHRTERGRPYCDPPWDMTLTHSGGWIATAVSQIGRVGIDVEGVRDIAPSLARRCLSHTELDWLGRAAGHATRNHRFCRLWTAKEAYLKAVGVGLAVDPREVTVDLCGDQPRLLGRPSERWQLSELGPAPGVCIPVHGACNMTKGRTLLDILFSAAREAPDQLIIQVDADAAEAHQTYRALLENSLRVAGGFQAMGLAVGQPVILLPGGSAEFLPAFWGALTAGLVPLPLAPVTEKVQAVRTRLGNPPIVVDDLLEPLVRRTFPPDIPEAPGAAHLLDVNALRAAPPTNALSEPAPEIWPSCSSPPAARAPPRASNSPTPTWWPTSTSCAPQARPRRATSW